jgi:L-xylulokinase
MRWHTRATVQPNRWLHMSTSPASASNANWYWDLIGATEISQITEVINEANKAFEKSDRPLFFPYLYGGPAGYAGGTNLDVISNWENKYEAAASVMEGVVFNHKHHFDMLSEKLDTSKRIVATGGSMQSPIWAQLVADIFNREIELSDTQESGARGIAILAGVSTGIYKSIEDAIKKCVGISSVVKPNQKRHQLFMDRYKQYRIEAKRITKV